VSRIRVQMQWAGECGVASVFDIYRLKNTKIPIKQKWMVSTETSEKKHTNNTRPGSGRVI
jgi:hypothetical protein